MLRRIVCIHIFSVRNSDKYTAHITTYTFKTVQVPRSGPNPRFIKLYTILVSAVMQFQNPIEIGLKLVRLKVFRIMDRTPSV